jgi:16S rRNA processing protein RimM
MAFPLVYVSQNVRLREEVTLKQFLECGKIVGTHGVKGELRVYPMADSPDFLTGFTTLWLDGGRTPVKVLSARVQKGVAVLRLEGVDTMEAAQALRGRLLYVNRDAVDMAPGEYFVQDLLGLKVINADNGQLYGELSEVSPTGANDVYHITFADGSIKLIPAIAQVVQSVDLDEGVMRIRPLAGLFDDED